MKEKEINKNKMLNQQSPNISTSTPQQTLSQSILTKNQFITTFSQYSKNPSLSTYSYNLSQSKEILNIIIKIFTDAMIERLEIRIPGFLYLKHILVPAHQGVKPTRGKVGESEPYWIKDSVRSTISIANNLKDLAKGEIAENVIKDDDSEDYD